MKKFSLILILLVLSISTNATPTTYGVRELTWYGSDSHHIELVAREDESSLSIMSILKLFVLSKKKIDLRIMPGLSEQSKSEIVDILRKKYPHEYSDASKSRGGLHDPLIMGVSKHFMESLEETNYYREVISAVKSVGYGECKVTSEKLDFTFGIPYIADLTFSCTKI